MSLAYSQQKGNSQPAAPPAPPRHIIDGVLMALFIFRIALPGLPETLPLGDAAAALLVVLALFRPSRYPSPAGGWYTAVCVFLLGFLVLSSLINDADFVRRLIKIVILMALGGVIASGRVDISSGLRGLGIALVINVPLYYLGLTPDKYAGSMTGFLGDKNVAGMYYAVLPFLLLTLVKRVWVKWSVLVVGLVAVGLTGSRASMGAYGIAVIWLFFSPRLKTFGKMVLGAVLFSVYEYIQVNFAQAGDFSNREGSDLLRARIDDAAQAKVDITPWFGGGLGEGQVQLSGLTWFFHNSYLALVAEGGIVVLITVVGLYAVVGLRLFRPKIDAQNAVLVSAATVSLLLVSFRLGEVFFTIPGFLILGIGLLTNAQNRSG
jgi:hypothetical protein